MRAEDILSTHAHHRFPLAIRVIASILVMTFLAQDIAWAHPEPLIRPRSSQDKLAPDTLFHQKDKQQIVEGAFVEHFIERHPSVGNNISLDAISKMLELEDIKGWCSSKNIICRVRRTEEKGISEILLAVPHWGILRYYDPSLSHEIEDASAPEHINSSLFKQHIIGISAARALSAPPFSATEMQRSIQHVNFLYSLAKRLLAVSFLLSAASVMAQTVVMKYYSDFHEAVWMVPVAGSIIFLSASLFFFLKCRISRESVFMRSISKLRIDQISDANTLARTIDRMLMLIRWCKNDYTISIRDILVNPRDYQELFFRPLYELLFIRLSKDFSGTEEFTEYCGRILQDEGAWELRKRIAQKDEHIITLFNKIKEGPTTVFARINLYGLLLFYLSADNNNPKEENIYLKHIMSKKFLVMKPEETICLAKRGVSDHTRGDSVIHYYPKGILFENTDNPIYRNSIMPQYAETQPENRKGTPHAKKVLEAIQLLKLQSHKEEYGYLNDRVVNFLKSSTVVEIDKDSPLLFSEPDHGVVRVMHVGRNRRVIVFTTRFIEEASISEIAAKINNAERFFEEDVNAGDELQSKRSNLTLNFFGDRKDGGEDSGLIDLKEFKKRLRVFMEEDILKKYGEGLWEAIKLEKRVDSLLRSGESSGNRSDFDEARKISGNLLDIWKGAGVSIWAEKAYCNMRLACEGVQLTDTGWAPIYCQRDLVTASLRYELWDHFRGRELENGERELGELEIYLTGIGSRKLKRSEIEDAKTIIYNLPIGKTVDHALKAHKQAAVTSKEISQIEEVERYAHALLGKYGTEYGHLENLELCKIDYSKDITPLEANLVTEQPVRTGKDDNKLRRNASSTADWLKKQTFRAVRSDLGLSQRYNFVTFIYGKIAGMKYPLLKKERLSLRDALNAFADAGFELKEFEQSDRGIMGFNTLERSDNAILDHFSTYLQSAIEDCLPRAGLLSTEVLDEIGSDDRNLLYEYLFSIAIMPYFTQEQSRYLREELFPENYVMIEEGRYKRKDIGKLGMVMRKVANRYSVFNKMIKFFKDLIINERESTGVRSAVLIGIAAIGLAAFSYYYSGAPMPGFISLCVVAGIVSYPGLLEFLKKIVERWRAGEAMRGYDIRIALKSARLIRRNLQLISKNRKDLSPFTDGEAIMILTDMIANFSGLRWPGGLNALLDETACALGSVICYSSSSAYYPEHWMHRAIIGMKEVLKNSRFSRRARAIAADAVIAHLNRQRRSISDDNQDGLLRYIAKLRFYRQEFQASRKKIGRRRSFMTNTAEPIGRVLRHIDMLEEDIYKKNKSLEAVLNPDRSRITPFFINVHPVPIVMDESLHLTEEELTPFVEACKKSTVTSLSLKAEGLLDTLPVTTNAANMRNAVAYFIDHNDTSVDYLVNVIFKNSLNDAEKFALTLMVCPGQSASPDAKPFFSNIPWDKLGILGIIIAATGATLYTGNPAYMLAPVAMAVQLSKKDKYPMKGRAVGALYLDESAKERVTGNVIVKNEGGFIAFYDPKYRKILYTQNGKEARFRAYPSGIRKGVYRLEKNNFIQGFIGNRIFYITPDALGEELEYFHEKRENHYTLNPDDVAKLKGLYGVNDTEGVIDKDMRLDYAKLAHKMLILIDICSIIFKIINNRPAEDWPELLAWMRSDNRTGQRFPDESELAAIDPSLPQHLHQYGKLSAIRKRLKFPDTSLQLNDDLHGELLLLFRKCHAVRPDNSFISMWTKVGDLSEKSKAAIKEYVDARWDGASTPSEEDTLKMIKRGFLSGIASADPEAILSIAEQLDRNRYFDDLILLNKTYEDMESDMPGRIASIAMAASEKMTGAKRNHAKYGLELKEGSYCITDDEIDERIKEEFLICVTKDDKPRPFPIRQARRMMGVLKNFTDESQDDSEEEFDSHAQASNVLNRLQEVDKKGLADTLLKLEKIIVRRQRSSETRKGIGAEDLGKVMWTFWRTDLGQDLLRYIRLDKVEPIYADGRYAVRYAVQDAESEDEYAEGPSDEELAKRRKETSRVPGNAARTNGFNRRTLLGFIPVTLVVNALSKLAGAEERGLNIDVSGKIDDRTNGSYPDIVNAAVLALQNIGRRRFNRYHDIDKVIFNIRAEGGLRVLIDKKPGSMPEPLFRAVIFTPDDLADPKKREAKINQVRDEIYGADHSLFEQVKVEWITDLFLTVLLAICAVIGAATLSTMWKRLVDSWRNKQKNDALRADHAYQEDAARRGNRGYELWKVNQSKHRKGMLSLGEHSDEPERPAISISNSEDERRAALQDHLDYITDEEKHAPLISLDLDDTVVPIGTFMNDETLDIVIKFIENGGFIAFNTLANKKWFYLRVLDALANKLGKDRQYLLNHVYLILPINDIDVLGDPGIYEGKTIFEYDIKAGAYHEIHRAEKELKANGLIWLAEHLKSKASLLASYGDRFDELLNDANTLGMPGIPIIVNVRGGIDDRLFQKTRNALIERGVYKAQAKEQHIFNTNFVGVNTTLADISWLTEKLSHKTMPPFETLPLSAGSPDEIIWTFKDGEVVNIGPESVVRVVVGEPYQGASGFVWAGVKDKSGNWDLDQLYLRPLLKNKSGQHEAVLPKNINVFKFFWTGGEDAKTGYVPGHWEERDFEINRRRTSAAPEDSTVAELKKEIRELQKTFYTDVAGYSEQKEAAGLLSPHARYSGGVRKALEKYLRAKGLTDDFVPIVRGSFALGIAHPNSDLEMYLLPAENCSRPINEEKILHEALAEVDIAWDDIQGDGTFDVIFNHADWYHPDSWTALKNQVLLHSRPLLVDPNNSALMLALQQRFDHQRQILGNKDLIAVYIADCINKLKSEVVSAEDSDPTKMVATAKMLFDAISFLVVIKQKPEAVVSNNPLSDNEQPFINILNKARGMKIGGEEITEDDLQQYIALRALFIRMYDKDFCRSMQFDKMFISRLQFLNNFVTKISNMMESELKDGLRGETEDDGISTDRDFVKAQDFTWETFVIDAKTGEKVRAVARIDHTQNILTRVILEVNGDCIGAFRCYLDKFQNRVSMDVSSVATNEKDQYGLDGERRFMCAGWRLMQAAVMLSQKVESGGAINLSSKKDNDGANAFYATLEASKMPEGAGFKFTEGDKKIGWYLDPTHAVSFIHNIDLLIEGRLSAVKSTASANTTMSSPRLYSEDRDEINFGLLEQIINDTVRELNYTEAYIIGSIRYLRSGHNRHDIDIALIVEKGREAYAAALKRFIDGLNIHLRQYNAMIRPAGKNHADSLFSGYKIVFSSGIEKIVEFYPRTSPREEAQESAGFWIPWVESTLDDVSFLNSESARYWVAAAYYSGEDFYASIRDDYEHLLRGDISVDQFSQNWKSDISNTLKRLQSQDVIAKIMQRHSEPISVNNLPASPASNTEPKAVSGMRPTATHGKERWFTRRRGDRKGMLSLGEHSDEPERLTSAAKNKKYDPKLGLSGSMRYTYAATIDKKNIEKIGNTLDIEIFPATMNTGKDVYAALNEDGAIMCVARRSIDELTGFAILNLMGQDDEFPGRPVIKLEAYGFDRFLSTADKAEIMKGLLTDGIKNSYIQLVGQTRNEIREGSRSNPHIPRYIVAYIPDPDFEYFKALRDDSDKIQFMSSRVIPSSSKHMEGSIKLVFDSKRFFEPATMPPRIAKGDAVRVDSGRVEPKNWDKEKIKVRPSQDGDIPGILKIENDSFKYPLSEEFLRYCLRHNWCLDVAAWEGQIIGFMAWEILRENGNAYHIVDFAAANGFRRMGVASALMENMFKKMRQNPSRPLLLEVPENNLPAQLFLKSNKIPVYFPKPANNETENINAITTESVERKAYWFDDASLYYDDYPETRERVYNFGRRSAPKTGLILPETFANALGCFGIDPKLSWNELSYFQKFQVGWYAAFVERHDISNMFGVVQFLKQHKNTRWYHWVARSIGIGAVWIAMTYALIISMHLLASSLGIPPELGLILAYLLKIHQIANIITHGFYNTIVLWAPLTMNGIFIEYNAGEPHIEFSLDKPSVNPWKYEIREGHKVGVQINSRNPAEYLPIIENVIREDQNFLEDTFKNVFGVNLDRSAIDKIRVTFLNKGGIKYAFVVRVIFKDKKEYLFSIKTTYPTLDQDDRINLINSMMFWRRAPEESGKHVSKFGARSIVYVKDFSSEIMLISQEYIYGPMLKDILDKKDMPFIMKTTAVKDAVNCYLNTHAKYGLPIWDPKPDNICLVYDSLRDWRPIDMDKIVTGSEYLQRPVRTREEYLEVLSNYYERYLDFSTDELAPNFSGISIAKNDDTTERDDRLKAIIEELVTEYGLGYRARKVIERTAIQLIAEMFKDRPNGVFAIRVVENPSGEINVKFICRSYNAEVKDPKDFTRDMPRGEFIIESGSKRWEAGLSEEFKDVGASTVSTGSRVCLTLSATAESPLVSLPSLRSGLRGTVRIEANNSELPAAEPKKDSIAESGLGEEGAVHDWFTLGVISLAGLIAFYTASPVAIALFAVMAILFISNKIFRAHLLKKYPWHDAKIYSVALSLRGAPFDRVRNSNICLSEKDIYNFLTTIEQKWELNDEQMLDLLYEIFALQAGIKANMSILRGNFHRIINEALILPLTFDEFICLLTFYRGVISDKGGSLDEAEYLMRRAVFGNSPSSNRQVYLETMLSKFRKYLKENSKKIDLNKDVLFEYAGTIAVETTKELAARENNSTTHAAEPNSISIINSPNEMTLKDSKVRPSEKRWNRRPKDRRGMISFGKPSDDENAVVGEKPIEQENKSLPDAQLNEVEEQIVICKSVEFMKPIIVSLERLIARIDPNSPNPAVLYALKDKLDEVRKYPLHYIFPACSDRYSWIGHAIGNGANSMLNDFSIKDDGSKVDMKALLLSLERMRVFINSLSEIIAAKELGSIDKYKRNGYILDITTLNRKSVTAETVEAPAAAVNIEQLNKTKAAKAIDIFNRLADRIVDINPDLNEKSLSMFKYSIRHGLCDRGRALWLNSMNGAWSEFRNLREYVKGLGTKETKQVPFGLLANLIAYEIRRLSPTDRNKVIPLLDEAYEAIGNIMLGQPYELKLLEEPSATVPDNAVSATAPAPEPRKGLNGFVGPAMIYMPMPAVLRCIDGCISWLADRLRIFAIRSLFKLGYLKTLDTIEAELDERFNKLTDALEYVKANWSEGMSQYNFDRKIKPLRDEVQTMIWFFARNAKTYTIDNDMKQKYDRLYKRVIAAEDALFFIDQCLPGAMMRLNQLRDQSDGLTTSVHAQYSNQQVSNMQLEKMRAALDAIIGKVMEECEYMHYRIVIPFFNIDHALWERRIKELEERAHVSRERIKYLDSSSLADEELVLLSRLYGSLEALHKDLVRAIIERDIEMLKAPAPAPRPEPRKGPAPSFDGKRYFTGFGSDENTNRGDRVSPDRVAPKTQAPKGKELSFRLRADILLKDLDNRVRDAIAASGIDAVIEPGAGDVLDPFYRIVKNGFKGRYLLVDFEEQSALQSYLIKRHPDIPASAYDLITGSIFDASVTRQVLQTITGSKRIIFGHRSIAFLFPKNISREEVRKRAVALEQYGLDFQIYYGAAGCHADLKNVLLSQGWNIYSVHNQYEDVLWILVKSASLPEYMNRLLSELKDDSKSAAEALRSPTGVDELKDEAGPAAAGGYRKSLWTTPEDASLLTPLNYVFIEEVGASIKDPDLQRKLDDAKRLNDRINPEGHWWGVAGKASDIIAKTKEFFLSLPIEDAGKEFGIIEECLQNLNDHGGVFGALLMYFKPRPAGKAECVFIVLDQGKAFLDKNENPLPIAKAVESGVTTKGYPDNMGIGLYLVNEATKRLDIIGVSSSGESRDGTYYQKSEDGQVHTGPLSDNDLNNIGIPHGARLIGSFEVKMQTSQSSISDTQQTSVVDPNVGVAPKEPSQKTSHDVIVDIGSMAETVEWFRIHYPDARVIAVQPSESSAAKIRDAFPDEKSSKVSLVPRRFEDWDVPSNVAGKVDEAYFILPQSVFTVSDKNSDEILQGIVTKLDYILKRTSGKFLLFEDGDRLTYIPAFQSLMSQLGFECKRLGPMSLDQAESLFPVLSASPTNAAFKYIGSDTRSPENWRNIKITALVATRKPAIAQMPQTPAAAESPAAELTTPAAAESPLDSANTETMVSLGTVRKEADKGESPAAEPKESNDTTPKHGVGAAAAGEELHHEEADELRMMLNKLCGKVGIAIPNDDDIRSFMSYAVQIEMSPRELAVKLDGLLAENMECIDQAYYTLKTALNRDYQPDAKLPREINERLQDLVALIDDIASRPGIRDAHNLVEQVSEIQTIVVDLGVLSHGISMTRVFPYRQDYWDRAISQAEQTLAACNIGNADKTDIDITMANARLTAVRQSLQNIIDMLKTLKAATFHEESAVLPGSSLQPSSTAKTPVPTASELPTAEVRPSFDISGWQELTALLKDYKDFLLSYQSLLDVTVDDGSDYFGKMEAFNDRLKALRKKIMAHPDPDSELCYAIGCLDGWIAQCHHVVSRIVGTYSDIGSQHETAKSQAVEMIQGIDEPSEAQPILKRLAETSMGSKGKFLLLSTQLLRSSMQDHEADLFSTRIDRFFSNMSQLASRRVTSQANLSQWLEDYQAYIKESFEIAADFFKLSYSDGISGSIQDIEELESQAAAHFAKPPSSRASSSGTSDKLVDGDRLPMNLVPGTSIMPVQALTTTGAPIAEPFTDVPKVMPPPAIDYVKELRDTLTMGIENLAPVAEIQQDLKGKGLILFADDVLERGAVIDLQQTLTTTDRVNGATMIIYEREKGSGILLKQIIDEASKEANKAVDTIVVDEAMLKDAYGKEDIYVNEASALECLMKYASAQGINKNDLVGVIKGRRRDGDLSTEEDINKLLNEHKMPVVNFESDNGVYSFVQALNMLISVKNSAESGNKVSDWYKKLPPINREDLQRIYEKYKALLEPALSA